MRYPDGKAIQLGDLIWWNEGCNTGRIALIVENDQLLEKWGLSEPGVFICNDLDADPLTCDVFQPSADFEDEGIAKKGTANGSIRHS